MTRFEIFRRLHHAPPIFRLPNCWDAASARIFEVTGFPAIATSSAAVAYALGTQDGNCLDVSAHLAAITRITAVISIPLSVDFESGYASDSGKLGRNIARLGTTGAAGYNLEDTRPDGALYALEEQCERIAAAKAAAPDLFLNARTDVYLHAVGAPESRLEQAQERLRAYLDAGADGIFVPGLAEPQAIRTLAHAFRKRPLNVLAGAGSPSVAELEELGVARVSVGSWPMRRAMTVAREFARDLLRDGNWASLAEPAISYDEMNALFTR